LLFATVFLNQYQAYARLGEVTIIVNLRNNSNKDQTVRIILYVPNGNELKQSEPITVQKRSEITIVLIVQPSQLITDSGFQVSISGPENCQNGINGPQLVPETVNFTLKEESMVLNDSKY
jgi:hypothetical protein